MKFTTALFLLFLGLKLTNFITWSWIWVTCPLWIGLVIWLIIIILTGIGITFFSKEK